jgi:G3E family GTPase
LVHPYLALRFHLDGVVTLIDAVNGSSTLDAHEEAVKQAAMADRLVLSKTDLLTEGGALRDLCARLAKLNPGAVCSTRQKGKPRRRRYSMPGSTIRIRKFLLGSAHGPNLLRVKGIVAPADDPARPVIIQGVQHVFHPPLRLPAWPDGDHTTRIVFGCGGCNRRPVAR